MEVLFIRHAIAEDQEKFAATGRPDRERPLTSKGRDRFVLATKGLQRIQSKIDVIFASPALRTLQTAKILQETFQMKNFITAQELFYSESEESILSLIRKHSSQSCIALVGHEPLLSSTVSWLLSGEQTVFTPFKKGGMACVRFTGELQPGSAQVSWALPPKILRQISQKS